MPEAKPGPKRKAKTKPRSTAELSAGAAAATAAARAAGRRAAARSPAPSPGKPTAVKMHAAKTRLSELVARVEAGEEVVILRGDVPVAKLVPMKPTVRRVPGAWEGRFTLDDSFFDPLPEEELKAWEGR